MKKPLIGIILGSTSDAPLAVKAAETLKNFDVDYEVGVASAHRTPADVVCYAQSASARGVTVIIAMAGLSAALPGVLAAHTTLPVIGVPVASGALQGTDALLAIAQMPPGVPVGCMGIGGAQNAALLALRIAGIGNPELTSALESAAERASESVRSSRESAAALKELKQVPPTAFQTGCEA